jgi:hypothetical protein
MQTLVTSRPALSALPLAATPSRCRALRHALRAAACLALIAAACAISFDAGRELGRHRLTATPAQALAQLTKPPTAVEHPANLAALARAFTNRTITVTCVRSSTSWQRVSQMTVLGFVNTAVPHRVFLGPAVCSEARNALHQPGRVTLARAVALQVLVHELVHTTGLSDERQTEALSFQLYRSTLVRFFGYSRAQADQMDKQAWHYHLGRPNAYQLPGIRQLRPVGRIDA